MQLPDHRKNMILAFTISHISDRAWVRAAAPKQVTAVAGSAVGSIVLRGTVSRAPQNKKSATRALFLRPDQTLRPMP
jgi:hypothetical protein